MISNKRKKIIEQLKEIAKEIRITDAKSSNMSYHESMDIAYKVIKLELFEDEMNYRKYNHTGDDGSS